MSDLKLIIFSILLFLVSIHLHGQEPGDLDLEFGTNGLVVSSYSIFGNETFMGVLVQSSGKIVNVGATDWASGQPLVNRLNPDGTLDTSFGENGSILINGPFGSPFFVTEAELQSDDKIVFIGLTNSTFYLVRLTADGMLDSSFGDNGFLLQDFPEADSQGLDLLIQNDGKILAVGSYSLDDDDAYLIIRYLADGSVDTSFGEQGFTAINPDGWDQRLLDVALQPDGKIVCAGSSSPIGRSILIRFSPDGILDTSFGEEGIVDANLSNNENSFCNLAIYPDGRILAAGDIISSSSFTDFSLARYLPDGMPDPSFGNNGVVKTAVGTGSAGLRGLELLSDGKILAGGFGRNNPDGRDFAIVRYLPDGSRDSTFNQNGITQTDINSQDDFAFDMVTQPDSKILLVGRTQFTGSQGNFVTARYINTIVPDLYLDTNIAFDSLCASSSLMEIKVTLASIADFSEEVTLSLEGLPNGVEFNYTPSNIVDPTSLVTITLNFEGVPSGVYPFAINATTNSLTKSKNITVDLIEDLPEIATLVAPLDASIFTTEEINIDWNPVDNSYYYNLEIATNPSFDINTIFNESLNQNSFSISELLEPGFYYWRVKSVNRCGGSEYSPVWAFQVASTECPSYPNSEIDLIIPDGTLDTMVSVITLSNLEDILNFSIHLDINHFYIGDLTAILESPHGESLILFDRPGFPESTFGCGFQGPLSLTFDDEAIFSSEELDLDCDTIPFNQPLIRSYRPFGGTLSELITEGVEGEWTLKIVDSAADFAGDLTSWSISVCTPPGPVVPIVLENNIPSNLANGGTVIFSDINLLATSEGSLPEDLRYILRSIPTTGELLNNGTTLNLGDEFTQKQINENELSYVHNGTTNFVDNFNFDIVNQATTWLPNQQYHFTIEAAMLTGSFVLVDGLNCFGDTDGVISIIANGGVPPYEYSLNNGPFQSVETFTGISAGIIEFTIRDSNQETFSTNPIAIVSPDVINPVVNVSENTATTSVTGGTFPYSYSIDGQNFQPSPVFDNLEIGFYTLTVQDGNGCTAMIDFEIMTTQTKQLLGTKNLIISPNPTTQFIKLNWDSAFRGLFDIQILNSIGQRVYFMDFNKNSSVFDTEIDLSSFSNGIYFVWLKGERGSIIRRIILLKD